MVRKEIWVWKCGVRNVAGERDSPCAVATNGAEGHQFRQDNSDQTKSFEKTQKKNKKNKGHLRKPSEKL